jgi:alkylated DNA nucleotide flippase Atl1
LAARQRGDRDGVFDLYARVAGEVRWGEWTTYGDVGLAAHGHPGNARQVGWAAATWAGFPNAHRVLQAGGRIAAGWRDLAGGGPAECQQLLEAEGIHFQNGRADPARYVPAATLRARLAPGNRVG